MDRTQQPTDRPAAAGTRPAGRPSADGRPAWWGLVTLVAGTLAVPLLLVDPVFAAVLGIVVTVVGLLGARLSTGTERRLHVTGAVLGVAAEVVLVLALTVLGSSVGAAPWPTLVSVP